MIKTLDNVYINMEDFSGFTIGYPNDSDFTVMAMKELVDNQTATIELGRYPSEKEQEEVRIEEYAFKRSNENGIFHIVEISTDYADGMQLLRLNKEDDPAGYCVDLRGKDQYVVFSDYQPDTLEFIRHPKYHDYEDILKEFKGKLESYLPEKFPWDERIGNYSYAYYA